MSNEDYQQPQSQQILDLMTHAMKIFKLILNEMEQQCRCMQNDGVLRQADKIEELFYKLETSISIIDGNESYRTNRILCQRFINRFMETINLFRNKCCSSYLKDYLNSIFGLLKQYQIESDKKNLLSLFFKVVLVFKRCRYNLKERLDFHTVYTSMACQSGASPAQNTKIRFETPKKTMEYKYKLTKEVLGAAELLVGMDVDVAALRSIFLQSRNNCTDLRENLMEGNKQIILYRQAYEVSYADWKNRRKRRKLKLNREQKLKKQLEIKIVKKDIENMQIQKMPKLANSTKFTTNRLRKMQAMQLQKTFLHLNQIKNQKFRRPYLEVKQVLVTGDEINYFSTKNNLQQSEEINRKASYFMYRGFKFEENSNRRQSVIENYRLATE